MNKGRPMKGPGGPMRGPGHHGQGGPRGMAAVKSIDPKTVGRLLGYIFRHHKTVMFIVLVCVMLSSVTAVAGSMFLETLIDDYIVPMTSQSSPDFAPLLRAVLIMGGIYLIGIISTAVHSQIMVVVSQGVLRDIRDEMFEKMQHLPIKYFDTNAHGDIMSRYTNDTDTLRQMISQSLIQTFSSLITLVTVFCAMISLSPILTLIAIVTVALIIFSTKNIAASSGKYFMKQQTSLGAVNGYIEEMIAGQKVVKVFCHEKHAKEDFDKLNGDLYENAFAANKYANILMPIMGNMSHLQYVILAISGGALAISGIGGLTLGAIVSFLQLSRSFTQPITQLSQQVSSIAMALAGAGRIFDLMDTEPEKDGGYVTLVNAKTDGDGNITETPEAHGRVGVEASPRRRQHHIYKGRGCRHNGQCRFCLRGREGRSSQYHAVRESRREGRFCRRDGRGQNHDNEPYKQILRYCRRKDTLRRYQYKQNKEGRSSPIARHRPSGYESVYRNGDGEYTLRKA